MDPTTVLWIGGAIILFLVAIGVMISISSQRSAEEERLGEYVDLDESPYNKKSNRSIPVTDWLTKKVEKSLLWR